MSFVLGLVAMLPSIPTATAAPAHVISFAGADLGYLGCVADPSRRAAPYFSVCMAVYAQTDGVHVEARVLEEDVVTQFKVQHSYYERAVVPVASLKADESGAIPVLYMDFDLPRTGHVELAVQSRASGDFRHRQTKTINHDYLYVVDSEASGTMTVEQGTINGRTVWEDSSGNNIYFFGNASASWVLLTPLERDG